MSIRHLDALFQPSRVLVVAANANAKPTANPTANPAENATARALAERVSAGGFPHPVEEIAWADGALRVAGDVYTPPARDGVLALISTPQESWAAATAALTALGVHAAVLFDAGTPGVPARSASATTASALAPLLRIARPGLLRLLGPASAGVISSRARLQASLSSQSALPGRVALISQSRSFANAAVAWAGARDIGFSKVVTTGIELDIDCGDLIDYLASDPETSAIVLAIDSVAPASTRKFMSAARAASRNKPVLALRSHHRRDDDGLFDAALRRAGMVRVDSIEDLLDAIEALNMGRLPVSDAVTIVSNGGFTAALTADAIHAAGARLAPVDADAQTALGALLQHVDAGDAPLLDVSNPINLGEVADVDHYGKVIQTLAPLAATGALFVVHTPSLHAPALALAERVVTEGRQWTRTLMSCWLGDFDPAVRALLHRHKIAVFPTPQRLARAFKHLREYQRNHILLAETPESLGTLPPTRTAQVRAALNAHISADVTRIDGAEAHDLLNALRINHFAHAYGYRPTALGPTMQVQVRRDVRFGMVLGVTPEMPFTESGRAPLTQWAILPVSTVLAGDLVARLPSAPQRAAATHRAFTRFFARLSEITVTVPEIEAIRVAAAYGEEGVVLLSCDMTLYGNRPSAEEQAARAAVRFAVRPYPVEWESTVEWHGESITIRPIRPQDEDTHRAFIDSLSADDMRMRFFGAVRTPEHSQLARMTQIDYDREMALIATSTDAHGDPMTLGVVRAVADPDNRTAEFAVVVRSDRKGRHLGGLLMRTIIDYCRARGTGQIVGEVLSENSRMIRLARSLGFVVKRSDEPGVMTLTLVLRADTAGMLPLSP